VTVLALWRARERQAGADFPRIGPATVKSA
jgi:hypothetical protein